SRWGGIVFSPDGTLLAFTTSENAIEVWDPTNNRNLLTVVGHTNIVYNLAFSPDGKQIATVSLDGTARIWDVATPLSLGLTTTNAAILQLEGINGLAFSPDGKQIATATSDGPTKVWDTHSGTLLYSLSGHSGAVQSIAFSPDGTELATAGTDTTARLWKAS